MSATATSEHPTGRAKVLATYDCDQGPRQLVGQRVDGIVRITDRSAAGGRAYLVEEGLTCMTELQAIVADYLEKAAELGHPPMEGWF